MTKTLSPQQEVVRNFPNTHRGSAFAEAVAGAGKTTTALFMIAETTGTVGCMASVDARPEARRFHSSMTGSAALPATSAGFARQT